MQVGDLVWAVAYDQYDWERIIERRLAIITEVDRFYVNPFVIHLLSCGNTGRTSERYLEPFTKKINLFS